MSTITRVDVVATVPPMPVVQFTEALPPVFTTVTFVIITDDSGTVGFGTIETDSFGSHDLSPLEALRPVVPALIGQDPLRPSAIAELAATRVPSGSRLVPAAGVEIACWDLLGRHARLPLYRLFGGARTEVAAYASLPFEADSRALLDLVAEVAAAGYPAAKLHVSGDPTSDVAQVTEVRNANPDLELIIDAESVYDRSGATLVGRALDDLDIRWFEAPLPDRDIDGYQELTRSLHTPVVPAGGLIDDVREIAHALKSSPWAAVRSQTLEGGVGHVRDLAALARAFSVDVQLCSYGTTVTQAIDLHLILGLGLGSYYEQPFPTQPWEFGTATPIRVDDGVVRAPAGDGLGMELDTAAIEEATVARFTVGGD